MLEGTSSTWSSYRGSFYRWQRRWHSLRVSRSPAVWSNGPVLGGLSFALLHSARHCELARRFSGDCVCAHASSSSEIVSAVRGIMAETLAPTIRHAIIQLSLIHISEPTRRTPIS